MPSVPRNETTERLLKMEQKKKQRGPGNRINGQKKGAAVAYFTMNPDKTLQEIADKFGVHKQTISNWVTDKLKRRKERKR